MKTTDTPVNGCWRCGHAFELATDVVGQAQPEPGDLSVCIECAAPGRFADDLTVVRPEPADYEAIVGSDIYARYAIALRAVTVDGAR